MAFVKTNVVKIVKEMEVKEADAGDKNWKGEIVKTGEKILVDKAK